MRREFSKQVKRDAFLRAGGQCEGEGCGARLTLGKFAYDHDVPDALGGDPTLDNCRVLCAACHKAKQEGRTSRASPRPSASATARRASGGRVP